ncbi:N-formylglutamate amidohydrolase [Taklimakanibacter lacteus]|uniref:N-formylglutamate amidohydrolase n=1 Tax=Taklimakanibacter lacteus TaxID=2268456 RepID=UPI000E66C913
MSGLLRPDEGEPVIVVNGDGKSPVVLVCEHAGKVIPRSLGSLGLSDEELSRHIAWDIGAEAVSRLVAKALDAPLLVQRYSRLVYDCNRPPESPDAMPVMSETTRIPGNDNLTPENRLARISEIYRPFHDRVARLLDHRAARGISSLFVTIHSFTPVYKGARRLLDLGVLHDRDTRLADKLLAAFGRLKDVVVKRNEPYGPEDGVCHTLNLHAQPRGLAYAMLEIRNDLIAQDAGQKLWAERLAEVLGALSLPQPRRAAS